VEEAYAARTTVATMRNCLGLNILSALLGKMDGYCALRNEASEKGLYATQDC
jgi:hypothetical protein